MDFAYLLEPRTTIALLALFIAFWSIITSRKHHRISVRPLLFDSLTSDSVNLECGLSIINKGLGPAIIKERHYYIDGKATSYRDLLKVFACKPAEFGFYISDLKPGIVISKDEKFDVIAVKWDSLKYRLPDDEELRRRIATDLESFAMLISQKITVKILYDSGYGESYKLVSAPKSTHSP